MFKSTQMWLRAIQLHVKQQEETDKCDSLSHLLDLRLMRSEVWHNNRKYAYILLGIGCSPQNHTLYMCLSQFQWPVIKT